MIYGFDTQEEDAAVGALLVYAIWRSRDVRRYKITPDVWSQVERFVKSSAKRSATLPEFLERLKPKLLCGTISPKAMALGIQGAIPLVQNASGEVFDFEIQSNAREFLTAVVAQADAKATIEKLYMETAWIILLVRDRLERERPIEKRLDVIMETENG